MQFYRAAFIFITGILMSSVLLGDDGTVEINQTCAVVDGCFSGDTSGFPVQINSPGSYVLTSNLNVSVAANAANTDGIHVTAGDVSIDLNGFQILGPASCTGTPVTSCTDIGQGRGVNGVAEGLSVRNGTVRGMGGHGIYLGSGGEAIDVRTIGNGDYGVSGFEHNRIRGAFAFRNAQNGLSSWANSSIRDSRAVGNGNVGIIPGPGSLARDNVANGNGSAGVFIRDNATAIDNVARGNDGDGVGCFTTSSARGNVLSDNTNQQLDSDCVSVADNICNGTPC